MKKYTPILCPICNRPLCSTIDYNCTNECTLYDGIGEKCLQKIYIGISGSRICNCIKENIVKTILKKYYNGKMPKDIRSKEGLIVDLDHSLLIKILSDRTVIKIDNYLLTDEDFEI